MHFFFFKSKFFVWVDSLDFGFCAHRARSFKVKISNRHHSCLLLVRDEFWLPVVNIEYLSLRHGTRFNHLRQRSIAPYAASVYLSHYFIEILLLVVLFDLGLDLWLMQWLCGSLDYGSLDWSSHHRWIMNHRSGLPDHHFVFIKVQIASSHPGEVTTHFIKNLERFLPHKARLSGLWIKYFRWDFFNFWKTRWGHFNDL